MKHLERLLMDPKITGNIRQNFFEKTFAKFGFLKFFFGKFGNLTPRKTSENLK